MEKPTFRVITDPSRKNHLSISLGENWINVVIYTDSEPTDYYLLKAISAVKMYTRDVQAKCDSERDAKYWLRAVSMVDPSLVTSVIPTLALGSVIPALVPQVPRQETKTVERSFEEFDIDGITKIVLAMMTSRGAAPSFNSELSKDVIKTYNYIKSVAAIPTAPIHVLEAVRKQVVKQR